MEVEIARPLGWLSKQHFEKGAFWLDLSELGHGWATVNHIGPAPHEQLGTGCLVLMTVRHRAGTVLNLALEDGETLELTPSHPLYVESSGWTRAGDLSPGQRLRTDRGSIAVTRTEPARPQQTVYNLEIGLDHTYRVGHDGIWAHNNSGACGGAGGGNDAGGGGSGPPRHPTDRMKESKGLNEALEQESGIGGAQDRAKRQNTYDDGTPAGNQSQINETKKTRDNVDNRLDRIHSSSDLDPEDVDEPMFPPDETSDEAE